MNDEIKTYSASLTSVLLFSKPEILVDISSLDDVAVSMTSKHLACCLSQQSSNTMRTVFDARAFDKHECCSSSECCDSCGMCSAVNWK